MINPVMAGRHIRCQECWPGLQVIGRGHLQRQEHARHPRSVSELRQPASNQTTYFQPILDVLDYQPSSLENVPNVVMVEGKNDSYALKYFHRSVGGLLGEMHLLPGGGAGSLGDVIRITSLGVASSSSYSTLMRPGRKPSKATKRSSVRSSETGYSSLDHRPKWKKTGMEFLVEEQDRLAIQNTAYPAATKFNKTHFNRALQELFLTKRKVPLSQTTQANFLKVLTFLKTNAYPS